MFAVLVLIATVLVLLYLLRKREETPPDWYEKSASGRITPSGERADDPARLEAMEELETRRQRLKSRLAEVDPERAARALRKMIQR